MSSMSSSLGQSIIPVTDVVDVSRLGEDGPRRQQRKQKYVLRGYQPQCPPRVGCPCPLTVGCPPCPLMVECPPCPLTVGCPPCPLMVECPPVSSKGGMSSMSSGGGMSASVLQGWNVRQCPPKGGMSSMSSEGGMSSSVLQGDVL